MGRHMKLNIRKASSSVSVEVFGDFPSRSNFFALVAARGRSRAESELLGASEFDLERELT
jgi:hypothetical protein